MKLREYQTNLIEDARDLMRRGCRSIVVQAPTGSGKTLLTAHMLRSAAKKGKVCWFIVHRRELILQSVRAFVGEGVSHGVIASGFAGARRCPVQVASIQTLIHRYQQYPKPDLIVFDEAHHCRAKTWAKIREAFPDAYHIGLTATPCRLDGKGLGKYFEEMIQGPSTRQLIDMGYLSPYKIFCPSNPDLSKCHTRMGDFIKAEIEAVCDKAKIVGDAIREYEKHCHAKRAATFCVSINHSKRTVEDFLSMDIPAEHVDGECSKQVRDEAVEMFRKNKTKILSNVALFGEGFDLPELEAVLLLAPTRSISKYLQSVGRCLRPVYSALYDLNTDEDRRQAIAAGPKPHAVILDHVNSVREHGFPCDEREWTLKDGIIKRQGSSDEPRVKVCPYCYAAMEPTAKQCEHCGHEFKPKCREIAKEEGELLELDPKKNRSPKFSEQGQARGIAQLIQLGRKRGYRYPERWAYNVHQARQRKKLNG